MGDLIRRLFGGTEFAKLFAAARERVEASGLEGAKSTTLVALTDRERDALAGLYGLKRRPGASFRVDLARLDRILRSSSAGASLLEVLEALGGSPADRRALRVAERSAEEALWAEAREAVASRPPLLEWLSDLRGQGLLRRAARGSGEREFLAAALRIVARLPAAGISLAVLAADATGDAHTLDAGTPLGGLVLRAAARLVGRSELPVGSAERRALWEEIGVACDPLSPHALVLGLRPARDGHLERYLRESAEAGEVVKLTLAQVARRSLELPAGTVVHVCENPSVVATAADRLGGRCPALVCTEGVPSTAVLLLLEGLRRGDARIRFRGDFDWGGLRIANDLFTRFSAEAWRFGTADYREAVATGLGTPGLVGVPVAARWDVDLGPALREVAQAVFEERLMERLVDDLANSGC